MRFAAPQLPFGSEFFYRSRSDVDSAHVSAVREVARYAWERIPFYQRLWSQAPVDPADIRSLEQFRELPTFTIEDIRKDLLEYPPFGSYQGVAPQAALRIQSSGGTTGTPRPYLYTRDDWENGKRVLSYVADIAGLHAGQVFQVSFSISTYLGGILIYEGLLSAGLVGILASSGAVTPTEIQVAMARDWGTNVWAATPSYALHLAEAARASGIDPAQDMQVATFLIGGEPSAESTRRRIAADWGCSVREVLGSVEAGGMIAVACSDDGEYLHVLENGLMYESLDPMTGGSARDGEDGTMVVTTLFKEAAPMIRYNTMDISSVVSSPCPTCGRTTKRVTPVKGRADEMVKVRGVFLHPPAIEAVVRGDRRCNGEFVIEVTGDPGSETITVEFETVAGVDRGTCERELAQAIKAKTGLTVAARGRETGSVQSRVSVGLTGKARRLIDRRVRDR